MGVSLEEAAAGIIRIVNANMAKGISGNSVERGYDLREFALITMGGAAALHAADIAGELNMARVIVPPMSGNFSAVGLVVADIQHDYVKTFAKKDYQIDPAELLGAFKEIEDKGIRQLVEEKVSGDSIEITWSADLRYEGQSWELNAPIEPVSKMEREGIKRIINDFHGLHQQVQPGRAARTGHGMSRSTMGRKGLFEFRKFRPQAQGRASQYGDDGIDFRLGDVGSG